MKIKFVITRACCIFQVKCKIRSFVWTIKPERWNRRFNCVKCILIAVPEKHHSTHRCATSNNNFTKCRESSEINVLSNFHNSNFVCSENNNKNFKSNRLQNINFKSAKFSCHFFLFFFSLDDEKKGSLFFFYMGYKGLTLLFFHASQARSKSDPWPWKSEALSREKRILFPLE